MTLNIEKYGATALACKLSKKSDKARRDYKLALLDGCKERGIDYRYERLSPQDTEIISFRWVQNQALAWADIETVYTTAELTTGDLIAA